MEFFRSNEFLCIFSDSIKLLPKNGKLTAFIASLSTALYASVMLLYNYATKSLMLDMFATITPGAGFDQDELRRDTALLFAAQLVFVLALSTLSFFSLVSTVLVSSVSYNAKTSSLKDLISMIYGSWRRALTTSLYVSALSTGYFATIAMLASPLWMYPHLPTFWLGVLILIPSFIFYLYLLVPWTLSVVVAVAEESFYGLEALGRAATLLKGKRVHGFLLNLFNALVSLIIFQCYRIKIGSHALQTTSLMLAICVSSLVQIFMWVAYTVFYFQCKMHHDSLHYTMLSAVVDLG